MQKDRKKNRDTSSRIKRQITTDRKTLTHTNTLSKQTALPAEWNHKAAKVTDNIKADRQTSKEHPGKHRGKTSQEKWNTTKMDLHHATHHIAPS